MADVQSRRFYRPVTAVVAFVLMLAMLLAAVGVIAYRQHSRLRGEALMSRGELAALLAARRGVGSDLMAVAARYLPDEDPGVQALGAQVDALAAPGTMADLARADKALGAAAAALLERLAALEDVRRSDRDALYVQQMLPQALARTAQDVKGAGYNQEAAAFNAALDSLTGRIARIAGVRPMAPFEVSDGDQGERFAIPADHALTPFRQAGAPQPVQDSALLLSQQTQRDIRTLDGRLREGADLSVAVVTRHFLGGAQPQDAAQALLDAREGGGRTVLLLLAVAEERYAVAVGGGVTSLLPQETIRTLATARLSAPFKAGAYDAAVGDFLRAMAGQVDAAGGGEIDTRDLFLPPAAATPEPAPGRDATPWRPPERAARRDADHDGTGWSLGKVVFIAIALYVVFGRGKRKGKRGGCASLAWLFLIFALAGMADIFVR